MRRRLSLGRQTRLLKSHDAWTRPLRSVPTQEKVLLILLGGGGYTVKNVARTWTYEIACAPGIEDTIDPKLPWNEEWFGPRYLLEVVASNMEDMDAKDGSLKQVRYAIMFFYVSASDNIHRINDLRELNSAPSIGKHNTPKGSLSRFPQRERYPRTNV